MADTETTANHGAIKSWAEARNGTPAKVEETDGGQGEGMIRIAFGQDDQGLEEISWDEWFRILDENDLALLHSTESGNQFNKLVSR